MQTTASAAIPAQSNILKTMQQPTAQNMIMTSNKKKKYTQQQAPPPKQPQQQQQQQQQNQPSFQINKSFNVVSMLKVNTTANAQQHVPQTQQTIQQSYANVVNRSLPPVMCGSNVVTVNNCQTNADILNSPTTIFNINHRGIVNNGSNNNSSSALDSTSTHLTTSAGYSIGSADVTAGGNGVGVNVGVNGRIGNSTSIGGKSGVGGGGGGGGGGSGGMIAMTNSTSSTHGNTLGITIGGVTSGTAYAHEKNLVGVNVGCIDNRKYDYKNTKLLSNNNFQATQEYIQSSGANNSGQIRTNQTGSMYRGPPASPAARNGARHVMPTMYPQAMHQSVQSVVVPTFTQYPRQAFQAPQYSYTQPLQPNFYSYQPYYSMQAHQRGAVGVNAGVGIGNTMSVQAGPNGPMAGPPGAAQTQIPLAPGTVLTNTVPPGTSPAAVLGVAPSTSGQQVGVQSLVMSPNVPPQQQQRANRPRTHRLQIIHPETKKNILEEMANEQLNKSSTSSDTDYPDQIYAEQQQMPLQTEIPGEPSNMAMGPGVIMMTTEPLRNMPYEMLDIHPMSQQQHDVVVSQTPVVSAMSDAPSVEILPATQKPRSKKIPIVSPKDEHISGQNIAEANEKQQTAKSLDEGTAKSDCVQQQLPTTQMQQQPQQYQSHQVPQLNTQQQQQQIPATSISADVSHINSISKEIPTVPDTPQQIQQQSVAEPGTASTTTTTSQNTASVPSDWFQNSPNSLENCNLSSINKSSETVATAATTATPAAQQQDAVVVSATTPIVNTANVSASTNEMRLTEKGSTTASATSNKETLITSSNSVNASNGAVSSDVGSVDNVVIESSNDTRTNNNNTTLDEGNNSNNELNKNNTNGDRLRKASDKSISTIDDASVPARHSKSQQQEYTAENVTKECDETDRASLQQSQQISKATVTDTNSNNLEKIAADDNTKMTNRAKSDVGEGSDSPSTAVTANGKMASSSGDDSCSTSATTTAAKIPTSATSNASSSAPSTTTTTAITQSSSAISQQQSLINYNEGQWSPNNPTGKKQYDRKQLLQLREAKASHAQPEVNNVNILPQPNLMPSFVRNPKRVQSMVGSSGSNRGSGASGMDGVGGNSGSGSFSSKQASMSGVHGRGSMKGMIRVNLSLNQDVKLNETDNAWRPRVLVKGSEGESDPEAKAKREKDELIRRVRGILNKLTPEKFDALVEEIIKLKIDTPDKMEDVMILVFEKAIDEPNFSVSYARLCHRLIMEVKAQDERMESGTKSNLGLFRSALLDKTEREFTHNVTKSKAKEMKLQPIIAKIAKCTDPIEKAELEAQLEEEERKIRRRSGGTVRFIGELFKISMLTGKIINSCIEALLKPNSEDMLECLCKLLTTVGAKFEQTPENPKDPKSNCYSLNKIIAKMQAIASKTDKEGARVSSRVRFMLQDVIDLRQNNWQSARNEAPKTMGQIEKEAKTEQLSSHYLNYGGSVSGSGGVGSNGPSSMGSSGKRDDRGGGRYNDSRSGGGYGGSHSQRGESRRQQQGGGGGGNSSGSGSHSNSNNDDSTWHVQTSKGSRCLDTNKLEGLSTANQNFDTKKMGGLSQFLWSHNGSRQSTPTTTPSNSFAALSSLSDTSRSNDRDRDRDRSGPRSKGSYNKGSMERDRDRYGMHSRSGSSQASRENSSSRGPQSVRGAINTSSMQKSASHSKYTQQQMPSNRMPTKPTISIYPTRGMDSNSYSTNQQSESKNSASRVAPAAVFEKSSDSDYHIIKLVVSDLLEIATNSKSFNNQIDQCISRVKESQRCALLHYIMTDYLHLGHVGKLQRRYLGNIVMYLIKHNFLSVDHFLLSYKHFCEEASDLELDIPELWKYFIEFSGPLISRKYITIYDLWNNQLKESVGRRFLKLYLDYCLTEIGPSFTRTMWKKLNIKWTDFMPENEVKNFIQSNKLEYIENENLKPTIVITEPREEHVNKVVENIEHLLKEGATADCIIDYINGNIVDIDKKFVRNLTAKLCNFAITYKDGSYKLETERFQNICIPILQRYIDSKEERELECLYSMQLLVHRLEHPRGLLSDLFGELYDADVIPQDSFIKWRDSNDQSAGKGVAVKGLNPFFMQVLSSETSDENN